MYTTTLLDTPEYEDKLFTRVFKFFQEEALEYVA